MFQELLQSSQKTLVANYYFSKIAGFYRSSHWRCSVKEVILERCSQNSHENTCVRDSILIKLQVRGCKKETLAQVSSCEFSKISKNTFFTEQLHRTASTFNFSEVAAVGLL